MKNALYFTLIFLLLSSCQNEAKLSFGPTTIVNDSCNGCPEILIAIPKALGTAKISKTINTAIEEELISLFSFDEEVEIASLKDAIKSFENGYLALKEQFSDEQTDWEAKIAGEISYEDANYITIALDSYIFSGGAHGYTSKRFLNFDKKKGVELDNEELFNNLENFSTYAETEFRKKENIPVDQSINYSGLMFEQDQFYLPENIGFTDEGLKLLYNVYEVASFADGTIELVLPHTEVKEYLATQPKP
jgi:hypothetical protein